MRSMKQFMAEMTDQFACMDTECKYIHVKERDC